MRLPAVCLVLTNDLTPTHTHAFPYCDKCKEGDEVKGVKGLKQPVGGNRKLLNVEEREAAKKANAGKKRAAKDKAKKAKEGEAWSSSDEEDHDREQEEEE